jgi:hypothetical protein
MIRYRLVSLRLNNLIRFDAKKLARKISRQKAMTNSDKHRAFILLTNTRLKVLTRAKNRERIEK